MRGNLIKLTGLLTMVMLLVNCGADIGTGSSYMSTVIVSGSAAQGPYDADVLIKKDINNDKICDSNASTIEPDNLDFNISVKSKPDLPSGIEASPVYVSSVDIYYKPLHGSPSLTSVSHNVGQTIDPDSTATISVEVLSQRQKENPPLHDLININEIYEYDVSLVFHLEEVYSGEKDTITVHQYIKVADFADDCQTTTP